MNSSNKPSKHIIAGSGGMPMAVTNEKDPFETLDDLMAAIEGLCPIWPPRDTFENFSQRRL